ncbi:MAG: DUF4294 domain-containing protein [Bacteroidetes bacterium]|nr:DUF4294 domain-containing protein [Bacteroidota bacterium]
MKKLVFLRKTNLCMRLIFALTGLLFCAPLMAQNSDEVRHLSTTAVLFDGDTLPVNRIQTVYVFPPLKFKNKKEEIEYNRLMRDVKKMYPYSKLAKSTLNDIKTAVETMPEGKQRDKYVKQMENDLVKAYSAELKACTMRQGRILLKLVDREVNQTSYEIIKELRGSFSAAMWQGVARLFGETLKTEYDAVGEDAYIEYIVCMIEMGVI